MGLAYEWLDANELRKRFPVFRPDPDDFAVFETKAGFLRPEAAVKAHLQIAVRHGAALHFEEPVSDWRVTKSDTVLVTTENAVYEASHLVMLRAHGRQSCSTRSDCRCMYAAM